MYQDFQEDYGVPAYKSKTIALYKSLKNPPVRWLVDGLIKEKGITVLYGSSGSMKSYSAVDLSCRIVNNLDFHGMQLQQGEVIYIAGEAPDETYERITAWTQEHGVTKRPLVCPWAVDLHKSSTIEELHTLVEEIGNVKLIVFDNLADCTAGVSLSDPDDVGERLKPNILSLVQKTKAAVLLLHHTGHNESHERGAKVIRDMTDTTIKSIKSSNHFDLEWKVEKQRRGQSGTSLHFHIEDISQKTGISNIAVIRSGKRSLQVEQIEGILSVIQENGPMDKNEVAKKMDMWRYAKSCPTSSFYAELHKLVETGALELNDKIISIPSKSPLA